MLVRDLFPEEKKFDKIGTGSYLCICSIPYIVSVVSGDGKVAAISLQTGHRWTREVAVSSSVKLTQSEAREILTTVFDAAELITREEAALLLKNCD